MKKTKNANLVKLELFSLGHCVRIRGFRTLSPRQRQLFASPHSVLAEFENEDCIYSAKTVTTTPGEILIIPNQLPTN